MHSIRAIVLCTFTIMCPAAIAEPFSAEPPTAAPDAAESVHVQPRSKGFAPHSAKVEAVQKRITTFNEMQRLLDASFDKKLIICRRC